MSSLSSLLSIFTFTTFCLLARGNMSYRYSFYYLVRLSFYDPFSSLTLSAYLDLYICTSRCSWCFRRKKSWEKRCRSWPCYRIPRKSPSGPWSVYFPWKGCVLFLGPVLWCIPLAKAKICLFTRRRFWSAYFGPCGQLLFHFQPDRWRKSLWRPFCFTSDLSAELRENAKNRRLWHSERLLWRCCRTKWCPGIPQRCRWLSPWVRWRWCSAYCPLLSWVLPCYWVNREVFRNKSRRSWM